MDEGPPDSPSHSRPGEGCTKPNCNCQPREGVHQLVQISNTVQVSSTTPPRSAAEDESQGFPASQGFGDQPGKIITELNGGFLGHFSIFHFSCSMKGQ